MEVDEIDKSQHYHQQDEMKKEEQVVVVVSEREQEQDVVANKLGLRSAIGVGGVKGNSLRVVYFYHDELAIYEHEANHLMKPFRAKLTHELLKSFGVYESCLEPMRPRLCTRTDLGQYHADNYLALLQISENYLASKGHLRGYLKPGLNLGGSSASGLLEEKDETWELMGQSLLRFNLNTSINPLFPGVYEYCRTYVTGSLGGAAKLNDKLTNIAINLFGGASRARSAWARSGCYVNDCVLAILELLKGHRRVLYIDIDFLHPDAVEEAFYATSSVMTLSFHRDEVSESNFPVSGRVDDIGVGDGEGFAVNFPFDSGVDDEMYTKAFETVVTKARAKFQPEAIVMQCGTSSLAGDRNGDFNLTSAGHAKCVRIVRDFNLPLLVLGGLGVNIGNAAKVWCQEIAILCGAEIPEKIESHHVEQPTYFAPEYNLLVPQTSVENVNDPARIEQITQTILERLEKIRLKI